MEKLEEKVTKAKELLPGQLKIELQNQVNQLNMKQQKNPNFVVIVEK